MELSNRDQIAGNLDTGLLKCIALFFMLIDHTGVIFFPKIMEFRIFGRIAMPLYAWCLVVGCCRTHDPLRYSIRMLFFAVLCQPLYMLTMRHSWSSLSILFLLFFAVVSIWGIRAKYHYSQIWAPALCFLTLCFLNVDYGWRGLLFILLLYAVRGSRASIAAVMIGYGLFWGVNTIQIRSFFGQELTFLLEKPFSDLLLPFFRIQTMAYLALPFMLIRTNSGIRMKRWAFYALYPLHLLLLLAAQLFMGTPVSQLLSVF